MLLCPGRSVVIQNRIYIGTTLSKRNSQLDIKLLISRPLTYKFKSPFQLVRIIEFNKRLIKVRMNEGWGNRNTKVRTVDLNAVIRGAGSTRQNLAGEHATNLGWQGRRHRRIVVPPSDGLTGPGIRIVQLVIRLVNQSGESSFLSVHRYRIYY